MRIHLMFLSLLALVVIGCGDTRSGPTVVYGDHMTFQDHPVTHRQLLELFPALRDQERAHSSFPQPPSPIGGGGSYPGQGGGGSFGSTVLGLYDPRSGDCYFVADNPNHPTSDELLRLQHEHVHRLVWLALEAHKLGHEEAAEALWGQAGAMWRDLAAKDISLCTHQELNDAFGVGKHGMMSATVVTRGLNECEIHVTPLCVASSSK